MRLFVAVPAAEALCHDVAAARRVIESHMSRVRGEAPRVVWVQPQSLHVTLRFIGDVADDRVPAIVEAVQEPFAIAPFTLSWRGLGAFPSVRRPRAIWIGVGEGATGLGQLESALAERLGGLFANERPDRAAAFHPHVTVGRVKMDNPAMDWAAAIGAVAVGAHPSTVAHVGLYRSRGLPGGLGYEEIGRGRLEG